ncbi:MAG: hypothetical protein ACLQMO_01210 [Acidobacteriaceae bacterium]
MSNGIFSKIGRALSIFGVSSPDDVRRMQARKIPPGPAKPAQTGPDATPAGDGPPQEKEGKEE